MHRDVVVVRLEAAPGPEFFGLPGVGVVGNSNAAVPMPKAAPSRTSLSLSITGCVMRFDPPDMGKW